MWAFPGSFCFSLVVFSGILYYSTLFNRLFLCVFRHIAGFIAVFPDRTNCCFSIGKIRNSRFFYYFISLFWKNGKSIYPQAEGFQACVAGIDQQGNIQTDPGAVYDDLSVGKGGEVARQRSGSAPPGTSTNAVFDSQGEQDKAGLYGVGQAGGPGSEVYVGCRM